MINRLAGQLDELYTAVVGMMLTGGFLFFT